MPNKIAIAKTTDVPVGEGRAFPVGDLMIAIFNDQGTFYAMDDFCPHQGASLACGYMEEGTVACPWHAWRFSMKDGSWLDSPKIRVPTYPVEIDGDQILVEIPDE